MDKQYTYSKLATGTQAVAVAVAGTEERLTSSSTTCRMVLIQAYPANVGNVVIGDSSIVATAGSERGIVLVPGATVELRIKDLTDVYVDAANANDGVSFTYFNN